MTYIKTYLVVLLLYLGNFVEGIELEGFDFENETEAKVIYNKTPTVIWDDGSTDELWNISSSAKTDQNINTSPGDYDITNITGELLARVGANSNSSSPESQNVLENDSDEAVSTWWDKDQLAEISVMNFISTDMSQDLTPDEFQVMMGKAKSAVVEDNGKGEAHRVLADSCTSFENSNRNPGTNVKVKDQPWSSSSSPICKMFVKYGSSSFVCSGVLVGKDLLLTARHCTYDACHGTPTSVNVMCGYGYLEGADHFAHYGTAVAAQSIYYTAYDAQAECKDGTSNGNFELDIQLVLLDRDIGDVVGYFGYDRNSYSHVNVRGYPGNSDLNRYIPHATEKLLTRFVASSFSANQVTLQGAWIWGGESGCPYYRLKDGNRYVLAVHSGGPTGCWEVGRRVTSQWSDIIAEQRRKHTPKQFCQIVQHHILDNGKGVGRESAIYSKTSQFVDSFVIVRVTISNAGNRAAKDLELNFYAESWGKVGTVRIANIPPFGVYQYNKRLRVNWIGEKTITAKWYDGGCLESGIVPRTAKLGIVRGIQTPRPTKMPTPRPTKMPTPRLTRMPTPRPTRMPTPRATRPSPTPRPTRMPTPRPTRMPTPRQTRPSPTPRPTRMPTPRPTRQPPTPRPTKFPTPRPTPRPTRMPTPRPTKDEDGTPGDSIKIDVNSEVRGVMKTGEEDWYSFDAEKNHVYHLELSFEADDLEMEFYTGCRRTSCRKLKGSSISPAYNSEITKYVSDRKEKVWIKVYRYQLYDSDGQHGETSYTFHLDFLTELN